MTTSSTQKHENLLEDLTVTHSYVLTHSLNYFRVLPERF